MRASARGRRLALAGGAAARGRERGLTLIELVFVMGLIGMLLGMGVGMLASLRLGDRAALGLVQNVIRAARNSAVARGAPALVRFDREARTLTAEGLEVIGTWHFESEALRGGGGLDGLLRDAELRPDGFTGKALGFAGLPPGSYAEVPVQSDPGFDLADGFALECALRLEGARGGSVVSLGGVVGLDVSGAGVVRAWMRPQAVDQEGRPFGGEPVALVSPPGALRAGAWTRVKVEYDRRRFRLWVEGLEVAREPRETPVWKIEGQLFLGDRRQSFEGSLDSLVVSAVVASESAELPEGVSFAPDAPPLIAFTPEGHLERELHTQPVLFHLVFDDEEGRSAPVRVGMYGTVD